MGWQVRIGGALWLALLTALVALVSCADAGPARSEPPHAVAAAPLVWAVEARLTPVGTWAGGFGGAVAVRGGVVAVGAPNTGELEAGLLYLFDREDEAWKLRRTLLPPYDRASMSFGAALAIEDDRLVVGTTKGIATQLRRRGVTWTHERTLSPGREPAVSGPCPVAFSRGVTAVLAQTDVLPDAPNGAVFLHDTDSRFELVPLPTKVGATLTGGVALHEDTLAVGTWDEVHVFRRGAAGWALETTLEIPHDADREAFGGAVALGRDELVTQHRFFESGAVVEEAVVYRRSGTSWSRASVIASPVEVAIGFGNVVALHGDRLALAATVWPTAGAAFVYRRAGDGWALEAAIPAPGEAPSDVVPVALALDDDSLVLGAPFEDARRGAAYVYRLRGDLGAVCDDARGCASGFCVGGICCDSACDGGCQVCGDGHCALAAASHVCRPSITACDVEERCDGVSTTCPYDAVVADGTSCGNGACQAGACRPAPTSPTTRPAPSTLDVAPVSRGSGCSATPGSPSDVAIALVFLGLVLLVARRRVALGVIAFAMALLLPRVVPAAPGAVEPSRYLERAQLPLPSSKASGRFGFSMAREADTLLVSQGTILGGPTAVWAYRRVETEWVPSGSLPVPALEPPSTFAFASALALKGDLAVVGASGNGKALVYRRSGAEWTLEATLASEEDDGFGFGVAIDGAMILVGAPGAKNADGDFVGAVDTFLRGTDGTWTRKERLAIDVPTLAFGVTLRADAGRLVVAAIYQGSPVAQHPPSTIFFLDRDGDTWNVRSTASEGVLSLTSYGNDLALQGDVAVVGSPSTSGYRGTVEVFARGPDGWRFEQALLPPADPQRRDFGQSVAIAGEMLAVAWPSAGGHGEVHLYRHGAGSWHELAPVRHAGSASDIFGASLVLDADELLVGATGESGTGAVHVFVPGELGGPCRSASECASGACVDGVCCESACGGGLADDCLACSVTAGGAKDGVCTTRSSGICRAATSECDLAESCDGTGASCPPDAVSSNGLACSGGSCSGGKCLAPVPAPSGEPLDASSAPATAPTALPVANGCSIVHGSSERAPWLVVVVAALLLSRRKWRSLLAVGLVLMVACRADERRDATRSSSATSALRWSATTKLTRTDTDLPIRFGSVLALQNDRLVVGAPTDRQGDGGAYAYRREGREWVFEQALHDPPEAGPGFGRHVSLDGDDVVIAKNADISLYHRGAAGVWTRQTLPSMGLDPLSSDVVRAVIVKDTIVAVSRSARLLDELPDAEPRTRFFVWERGDAGWRSTASWVVEDGVSFGVTAEISFDGERVVLGAGHHVYVYRRVGDGTWPLEVALPAPLEADVYFGIGVAIEGDTLLVTTHGAGVNPVLDDFRRTDAGWQRLQTLSTAGTRASTIGVWIALEGNEAFLTEDSTEYVHHLVREHGIWRQEDELALGAPDRGGILCIGLSHGTAVFGSPFIGAQTGAVYVYELRASLGQSCVASTDCASSFCIDGVCCDTACGGGDPTDCASCNEPATIGTCAPAAAGRTCREATSDCDVADVCDGRAVTCGADLLAVNGTSCSEGVCLAGECQGVASGLEPERDAGASPPPPTLGRASGCSAAPGAKPSGLAVMVAVLLALALRRRRWLAAGALALLTERVPMVIEHDGWDVELGASGALVRSDDETAFTIRTVAFGRGPALRAVEPVEPERDGDRLRLVHEGFTEWYAPAGHGVEHGFDVDARPEGAGPLRIAMALAVSARFHYGEIHALDAAGRPLPVAVGARDGYLELAVDDRDATYPVVIDPLIWRDAAVLDAPRGPAQFGFALAASGERLVVGAPRNGSGGDAHAFVREGHSWKLESDLALREILFSFSAYGATVAVEGDRLVVGAPQAGAINPDPTSPFPFKDVGAAWIFERRGGIWVEAQKLDPPAPVPLSLFGWSIALQGDTMAISDIGALGIDGAGDLIGSVYIYRRSPITNAWEPTASLEADGDARYFGVSVALEGDTLVVGASNSPYFSTAASRLFFFHREGEVWKRDASFTARQGFTGHNLFADQVALSGDTAVTLSNEESTAEPRIFERKNGVWSSGPLLPVPVGDVRQRPRAVSLRGDRLLVGLPLLDRGRGQALLYERTNGEWKASRTFRAPDRAEDDGFGTQVLLHGDLALVSAPGRHGNMGAVYTFELGPDPQACTSANQCASGFCVDGFCCDTACGAGDPGDCLACSVAAGAPRDGVCAPSAPRVCRPARDECDVAEQCDGANAVCPADVTSPNGAVCRESGQCFAGQCVDVVPVSSVDAGGVPAVTPRVAAPGGCSTSSSHQYEVYGLLAIAWLVRRRR